MNINSLHTEIMHFYNYDTAYRAAEVKQALSHAHTIFSTQLSSIRMNNTKNCTNNSILDSIIHVTDDTINL